MDGAGLDSRQNQETSLFFQSSRPALGATTPLTQYLPVVLSEGKAAGGWEIKNECSHFCIAAVCLHSAATSVLLLYAYMTWKGQPYFLLFFENNHLRNLCGHKKFLLLTGSYYILRGILCGSVLNRWWKNEFLQYVKAWDTTSGPWLHSALNAWSTVHSWQEQHYTSHMTSSTLTTIAALHFTHDLQYTHDKSNTTLHTWSPVHSRQEQHYISHTLQHTHEKSSTTLNTWSPVNSRQEQHYTSHMISNTLTTRAALHFTHDLQQHSRKEQHYTSHMISSTLTTRAALHFTHDLQYTHDKSSTTLPTWSSVHSRQEQHYTSIMISSTFTTAALHFTHDLQYTHGNSSTTLHTWHAQHLHNLSSSVGTCRSAVRTPNAVLLSYRYCPQFRDRPSRPA